MAKKMTAEEALAEILAKIDTATADGKAKYNEVLAELNAIKGVQAEQHLILQEHMRRTAANEAILAVVKETQDDQRKFFTTEIEPLKKHVNMWGGVGKALTVLGTLASIAAAVYKFLV